LLYTWNKASMTLEQPASCTLSRLSKHGAEAEPAGEEEFILCDHLVTVKYNATMEDLHQVAKAGDDLIELDIETGAISLEVGDYVATDNESGSECDEGEGGAYDDNENKD
jgi:hypothetical protein